jgi:hypothetical protein
MERGADQTPLELPTTANEFAAQPPSAGNHVDANY